MFTNLSFDYYFWVVAIGTMSLGITAGAIGSSMVLEKQSQLGDAIGHAVYPGIIISFMLFQSRMPLLLLLGAVGAGLLAFWVIQLLKQHSHYSYESILALVLSGFFGIGLVLTSYIQGNSHFQKAAQAGLKNYIMGQAAYLMKEDVQLIILVCGFMLVIFFMLYPKIKLALFDKTFAQTQGISPRLMSQILMFMCLLLICLGLKAVGAILISSMLVAPTVAALQWSNHYHKVIFLAAFFGMVAAFFGTLLSTHIPDLATGSTIVLCLSLIAFISILFGPNGYGKVIFKKGRKS